MVPGSAWPEASSGWSRPRLLASVVDPAEAAMALRAGADVIDVKDPRRGSLGACSLDVLRAVVALRDAGGRAVPVSAALGDAPDPGETPLLAARAGACGADYVKIGLCGVRDASCAARLLPPIIDAARRGSAAIRVVAATFVDTDLCLPPAGLPSAAAAAGASGVLLDTALKDGRTLFDHLTPEILIRFVKECRRTGLLCGLAGSLRASDVPRLLEIGPDFIGARGAICRAGREGPLDVRRLGDFQGALHEARAAAVTPRVGQPREGPAPGGSGHRGCGSPLPVAPGRGRADRPRRGGPA
jgi:(5-formylfuran-3-yl)methyl phosphate synthase